MPHEDVTLYMLRKQHRTWSTKIVGCSNAAKWPPVSCVSKKRKSVKRRRAKRSEVLKISFWKTLHPNGTGIVSAVLLERVVASGLPDPPGRLSFQRV